MKHSAQTSLLYLSRVGFNLNPDLIICSSFLLANFSFKLLGFMINPSPVVFYCIRISVLEGHNVFMLCPHF